MDLRIHSVGWSLHHFAQNVTDRQDGTARISIHLLCNLLPPLPSCLNCYSYLPYGTTVIRFVDCMRHLSYIPRTSLDPFSIVFIGGFKLDSTVASNPQHWLISHARYRELQDTCMGAAMCHDLPGKISIVRIFLARVLQVCMLARIITLFPSSISVDPMLDFTSER